MKKIRKKNGVRSKLILVPEKNAPLVHLDFALLHGSLRDPEGLDGVSSMTMSMLLRGTQKKDAQAFHLALDSLGAEIHIGKYRESMRIYGVVLSSKLPAFLDLLEEMLVSPAFSKVEFEKVRDQIRSSLRDEMGSDDDVADRRFQEYMLWGSAYGRITSGSLETIDKIDLSDLKAFYQKFFRSEDFVVGATGGFDRKFLEKRIKEILGSLQNGSASPLDVKEPVFKKGKSLILLNKPGRSQAQVLIGSSGVSFAQKEYFPMLVANHVFGGGSFSARLMKEVREKRGWSYGAYSWYRSGKKPLYFAMHSVPSNKDAIPAIQLMLGLFREYAKKGISKAEFTFAKKSLVSQSAFLQDTVRKRLDNQVTEAVLDLPKGFYDGYQERLKRLTYGQVQRAIKKTVDPTRIFALVLVSVDAVKKDLVDLKDFKNIWIRSFDAPPEDPMNFETKDRLIVSPSRRARKADS